MYKQHCVTKEKYEVMYKTNEESDKRMDLSVGEDLESFIERIKTGKINEDIISQKVDRSRTFLLCLLDEEKRKKLGQKDEEFMKTFQYHQFYEPKDKLIVGPVDVPEAEWKASESNLKFAKSICFRETYFIDS